MSNIKSEWFSQPFLGVSDQRLSEVRHVESDFPLRTFSDLAEWEQFKEAAKEQIRTSLGMLPGVPVCEPHVERFDRCVYQHYITEKVLFESLPGFYVTGCLYWPVKMDEPVPMVLNPHGHWDDGRFEMSDITAIPQRCANFAMRGIAAFSFDMIGFGDSRQLTHAGYSGLEWDLWNESLLGLQIHNCLRALDFVWNLPEIDRTRIGSTGASGGGTQTFFMTALDDRISVSMPVNMISTTFQGSCICEYASNLHIGLSNIEIGALMAPRPMMLAGSEGDWTWDLPEKTYPWLKSIYQLYGAEENLAYFFRSGPHGYQQNAQEAAYRWFCEKLLNQKLTDEEAKERPIEEGTLESVRIFGQNTDRTLPPLTHRALFEAQKARKAEAVQKALQTEEGQADLRKALAFAIGKTDVAFAQKGVEETEEDGFILRRELLCGTNGAEIPMVTLLPKKTCKKVLLFASPDGKRGLLKRLGASLDALLDMGYAVACADLFMTGEYIRPFGSCGRNFSIPHYDWCIHLYFTAYNYTDTAYRCQDYIGVYQYLLKRFEQVTPAGDGNASALVCAVLPFLPEVKEAYGSQNEWKDWDDEDFVAHFYLPGFLNAGGFEVCEKLSGVSVKPLPVPPCEDPVI